MTRPAEALLAASIMMSSSMMASETGELKLCTRKTSPSRSDSVYCTIRFSLVNLMVSLLPRRMPQVLTDFFGERTVALPGKHEQRATVAVHSGSIPWEGSQGSAVSRQRSAVSKEKIRLKGVGDMIRTFTANQISGRRRTFILAFALSDSLTPDR